MARKKPNEAQTAIKVRMSRALRGAIQREAIHDEQSEGAWMRMAAVLLLRRRSKWPPHPPLPPLSEE